MTNATLRRSKDRKVATLITKSGSASIANSFGLPAGLDFSCPSANSVCSKVCYAGKIERRYVDTFNMLNANFEALKNTDMDGMVQLLDTMIADFVRESDKRNAPKLFRIHWDGDFFSADYTRAWAKVIKRHSDVQFWAYTRVVASAVMLKDIANLAIYFSTDSVNRAQGEILAKSGIRLAYLADTFEDGKTDMRAMGKSGIPCPENAGKIAMEGACVTCGQCVFGRNDILFSVKKR